MKFALATVKKKTQGVLQYLTIQIWYTEKQNSCHAKAMKIQSSATSCYSQLGLPQALLLICSVTAVTQFDFGFQSCRRVALQDRPFGGLGSSSVRRAWIWTARIRLCGSCSSQPAFGMDLDLDLDSTGLCVGPGWRPMLRSLQALLAISCSFTPNTPEDWQVPRSWREVASHEPSTTCQLSTRKFAAVAPQPLSFRTSRWLYIYVYVYIYMHIYT